ncbi:hypothetical protein NY78_2185 [Desulfovibrio sp. TomC]|nr:hypothetical protein NY78_2185 [Desulfovibrio sp. TomC]
MAGSHGGQGSSSPKDFGDLEVRIKPGQIERIPGALFAHAFSTIPSVGAGVTRLGGERQSLFARSFFRAVAL